MEKSQKKQNEDEKVTSEKKTSKLLGVFVMIGGALSLVLMIVFATKFALTPTNVKKPVLGVTINGKPTNTNFNDPNFYACIINELNNKNIDGINNRAYIHNVTEAELALMTELSCHHTTNNKITDTAGLGLMKNLKTLFLSDNNIESIDLSDNTKLETINLAQNNLTSIDIKPIKNTIKEIVLSQNKNLANINWGAIFDKLEVLRLEETNLATVYAVFATNLRELSLVDNPQLTEVGGFRGNKLETLKLSNTGISTLFLDGVLAVSLKTLWLDNTPELTNTTTPVTNLYLSAIPQQLDINEEKSLNGIRICSKLEELKISKSKITNINFTADTEVGISGTPSLKRLYIEDMPGLTSVVGLGSATTLINLVISGTSTNSIDISKNAELTQMDLSNNNLTAISLSDQPNLRSLSLSGNKLTSADITNNTKLTELNLSNNPSLKNMDSSLPKVNLSNNIELRKLDISNSELTSIDLAKNTKLRNLDLSHNGLNDIDLANNKGLMELFLSNNSLTSINVSENKALRTLRINNNPKLTSLVLGDNINVVNNLLLKDSPLLSTVSMLTDSSGFEFNPNSTLLKIELGHAANGINSGVIGRVKRSLTEDSSTITSTGIVDKNGNPLASDAKLKTGDIIRGLYEGGSVDVALYSLGDVVPDGEITFSDILKIFHQARELDVMRSDAEIAAGDVVTDGKIEFKDALKLFHFLKGAINEI